MTEREQQGAFQTDLENLVNRYLDEFDLTYESLIGCLEVEKSKLINQLLNPELFDESDEDDDEDPDWDSEE